MAHPARTVLFVAALGLGLATHATAQVGINVQLHGAPLISSLLEQLGAIEGNRFTSTAREIVAFDRSGPERLYTITYPDHTCLTFAAALLRLESPTLLQQSRIRHEVNRFNGSSAVGTMYYDEGSGEVSMLHRLDPGHCGIGRMVEVARAFGDLVVAERRTLAAVNHL